MSKRSVAPLWAPKPSGGLRRASVLAVLAVGLLAGCQGTPPPLTTTTTSTPGDTTSTPGDTTLPEPGSLKSPPPTPEGSSPTTEPVTGTFVESFAGHPSSPRSVMNNYDSAFANWFTSPIVQGPKGWDNTLTPMDAQHDEECRGEPRTRRVDGSFENTVYMCHDHIMTAMNPKSTGTANSLTNLQPNYMLDLSSGNGTVSIDVSTHSPTPGSWWEIWLTPKSDWLLHPSDHWFHMSGLPRKAVKVSINDFPGSFKRLQVEGYQNYDVVNSAFGDAENWQGPPIDHFISPVDLSTLLPRDTYEVTIRDDRYIDIHITDRATETRDLVRTVTMPSGFLGDDVVVQFVDANYEPDLNGKVGCSGASDCPQRRPNTWHWDNAVISPAKRYEIIKGDKYVVNGGYVGGNNDPQEIRFDRPAPAGASLVFVGQANRNDFDVSFDGGASWQDPVPVRGRNEPAFTGIGDGVTDLLSYRLSAPEGADSILIRGKGSTWSTHYSDGWGAMSFGLVTI